MHRIEWTETARRDIREIYAFIARDSAQYARRVVDRITAAIDGARQFPLAGALVPEWDEGNYREVFVGAYRIIYVFDGVVLRVVTVIHGARQLPDHDNV